MFTPLNTEFGWKVKPNSMLMAMNIEFDCVVKPNSHFTKTNIDFGCAMSNMCRDIETTAPRGPGRGRTPTQKHPPAPRRGARRPRLTAGPGTAHRPDSTPVSPPG